MFRAEMVSKYWAGGTSCGGRKVPQQSRPQGKPSSEAIEVQVVGVAEDGYCRAVD